MPRKPTGRPTGRPVGSGRLGLGTQDPHTRLTVRIPPDLYTRLEAFAKGRSYSRGTPQLAGCVRTLLEHALACPYKRQTENDTRSLDAVRQRGRVPPRHLDAGDRADLPQSVTTGPAIAPLGQYFGRPCKARGHVSHGYAASGAQQNLRTMAGKCVACEAAKKATKQAATHAREGEGGGLL